MAVTADASYQVLNDECIRIDPWMAVGGARPLGHRQIPLPVRATAGGFETTAFADHFKDQTYFPELKPCVWTLFYIRFHFEAAGRNFEAGAPSSGLAFNPGTYRRRCNTTIRRHPGVPNTCFPETAPLRPGHEFFLLDLTVTRPTPPL